MSSQSMQAVPLLASITGILVGCIFVSGLIGMQMFSEPYHHACNHIGTGDREPLPEDALAEWGCGGARSCPEEYNCTNVSTRDILTYNVAGFDNIGTAMLTAFQVPSLHRLGAHMLLASTCARRQRLGTAATVSIVCAAGEHSCRLVQNLLPYLGWHRTHLPCLLCRYHHVCQLHCHEPLLGR
jgi:hypothetical protein